MKPLSRNTGNWLVAGLALLVSLLVAEAAVRIFFPDVGWTQKKDPLLGWSSREYRRFEPSPKPDHHERILFLGDSFLAGSGVSHLDERFPVLVNRMLGPNVDVAIFAAGGWGTDQQFLSYREKGINWEPDLVVVAFTANNDISNILSHRHGKRALKPYFTYGADSKLELRDGIGGPFISREVDRSSTGSLWRKSYLLSFVALTLGQISQNTTGKNYDPGNFPDVDERYKLFGTIERAKEINEGLSPLTWSPQIGVDHASAYIHEDFDNNTYQWRLLEDILRLLKVEVESAGARLVVMLLPVIFNPRDLNTVAGGSFTKEFDTPAGRFTFRSREPRDRLAEICRRSEIRFFDPTDQFIQEIERGDLLEAVWPNARDRHFSAAGHEILSRYVAEWALDMLGLTEQTGVPAD